MLATLQVVSRIEQDNVLDWISTIPYAKHHKDKKNKVLEGTGRWLFRHSDFLTWRHWSGSNILWLYGSAGSGKSTLALVMNYNTSTLNILTFS